MCDSLSGVLQTLSVRFFNSRGKPRIPSFKELLEFDNRPLLYISNFELPYEYRSLNSTVGPLIIQSLLYDTHLADHWSIAMYIPWAKCQFLEADDARYSRLNKFPAAPREDNMFPAAPSREEESSSSYWANRADTLHLQDMRQFFRAGFHQVCDPTVVNTSIDYMYTLPMMAYEHEEPLLSVEEVFLKVQIVRLPPMPPQSTEESKFQELLKIRVSTRKEHGKRIELCRRFLRERIPDVFAPATEQELQQTRDELSKLEGQLRFLEGGPEDHQQLSYFRLMVEDFRASQGRIMSKISELRDTLAEKEKKLRTFDSDVRNAVIEFLSSHTINLDNLIIQSGAIHTCAFNTVDEYIELLLDLLSSDTMRTKALNHPDSSNGLTPLMVTVEAAAGTTDSWNCCRETCEFLLDRGADKDIQNRRGYTALGCLRLARQCVLDYNVTNSLENIPRVRDEIAVAKIGAAVLEGILMPTGGPSPAADDNAFSGDEDDNDTDDGFMWD